ncbi:unnamed protein product [Lymnaea stagnalis]|uniref:G-protein coupled receptors family 1 profile domain-containing protein n=1 Tax=Lymnaea stagnalis TaxID=6523 RepID=A0AAV2HGL3_LYMST
MDALGNSKMNFSTEETPISDPTTSLIVKVWSIFDRHNLGLRLASNEMREIFQLVNYVSLCGAISLFGIAGNILNIIVFRKQGYADTTNISLMGLTIADLMSLLTMLWTSICYNPLFANSGVPFNSLDLMYLSGGYPHTCFNRITGFITAFITFERCLCIALPLKVKTIITPHRTRWTIIVIFFFTMAIFSPFYYANRLEWQNGTILHLVYAKEREAVESVIFYIHSVALQALSLLVVIVCTIILVVQLNTKSKWRSSVTKPGANVESASMKEKRAVKMIALISTVFIICFMPGSLIFFTMAYEPEFNFTGDFKNIFFVVWSVAFVLETVNASVSILIYFNMSSKYHQVVIQLVYTQPH